MDSDAAVDATLADLLQTSTVVAPRVQRRDPNAVITHQAMQRVQYGYFGKPVNRVWARWSDGRVTHSDDIDVYEDTPHGRLCLNWFVNIDCDEDMLPPADLDWFSTGAGRPVASVPVPREAFDAPWNDGWEPAPDPTGARTPRDE